MVVWSEFTDNPLKGDKLSDRQKFVVGSDVLFFDFEYSLHVGGRVVALFFSTKKGDVTQRMCDKVAERIVDAVKVTVTERQISIFCPWVKSTGDARRLAERFVELLELERRNCAQARQRASKGASRSQMTVK